jgi:hypothetical protein
MPGPDEPTAYESVAPHTHVGRFRDVLRTWMKARARRPAPLGQAQAADRPDRRPDASTSRALSSEQVARQLVFLATASRKDRDDLLAVLCVAAWPTRSSQVS